MDKGLDEHTQDGLGIAFDIGTTTLGGCSVELSDGAGVRTHMLTNPQSRWGEDVVSRMRSIDEDPSLLETLNKELIGALNRIVEEVAGGRRTEIKELSAAGNTVMEHILLGVSPAHMATAPYRPAFKEAQCVNAQGAGLEVPPEAALYTFPIIGPFVGGDTVALILSLDIDKRGGARRSYGPALAIDIGTNTEIVLATEGGIFAASSPAGPAFEGGEISCGMRAAKGAIEDVSIEADTVTLDVIGNTTPKGICGSGLVAAAAALLDSGVMDPTGRIKDPREVPTNLSARIKKAGIEKNKTGNSFLLYKGAGVELSLTQDDIRALQTARGALRAAIGVLLKRAGLTEGVIEKVYMAGAFGSRINQDGLFRAGILSPDWTGRVEYVGDAALAGAKRVLGSRENKTRAGNIARSAKYVPLSGNPHFEREFIRSMDF